MLTCRWLLANAGAIPLSELGVEVTNGQQVWLTKHHIGHTVALVALLRLLQTVSDSQTSTCRYQMMPGACEVHLAGLCAPVSQLDCCNHGRVTLCIPWGAQGNIWHMHF